MKVIKKGRPQKGWAKQITCTGKGNGRGGCGAVLLIEESDLFRTGKHSRDESEYYATFKCSECGVLTDVNGYPGDVMKLPAPPGLGGRTPEEMAVRRPGRPVDKDDPYSLCGCGKSGCYMCTED